MTQRVTRSWYSPGCRRRVLVEDAHPALAVSDFSLFEEAGFAVALCSGPSAGQACPVLDGGECAVLARADAVLHGLDTALGIPDAIRRRHPEIAVVVARARDRAGSVAPVPEGCATVAYPCSVNGQLHALRRALSARRG